MPRGRQRLLDLTELAECHHLGEHQQRLARLGEVGWKRRVHLASLVDQWQRVVAPTGGGECERPAPQHFEPRAEHRGRWRALRAGDRLTHRARHRQQQHVVRLDVLPRFGLGHLVERAHQEPDRLGDATGAEEHVVGAAAHHLGPHRIVELAVVDVREQPLHARGVAEAELHLGLQLHDLGGAIELARLAEDAVGHRVVTLDEGETGRLGEAVGFDTSAALESPRDDTHAIARAARTHLGDRVGKRAADAPAANLGDLLGDHFGEQRMHERDIGPAPALPHRQQTPLLQHFEHFPADHHLEHTEPELARDREQLDDLALLVAEPGEPLGDEQLQRRGRVHQALGEVPHALGLDEPAAVERGLDELAQHTGVARCCLGELAQALVVDRRAEHAVQERGDGVVGEEHRLDGVKVPVLHEQLHRIIGRRVAAGTQRAHDERGAGVHERHQQRARQLVEVVDVVGHHHPAPPVADLFERGAGAVEQQPAFELAFRPGDMRDVGGQEVRQRREGNSLRLGMTRDPCDREARVGR